ncbi:DUF4301 family protein [Marinoscillum furvescens]|uniref:Uncharacterized protein DUF4301 n=1 Tax=Marinoscillum furvescens DSM 4134 TaxID=1122208 RepID=A0A3D9L2X5_MARFU|nr:DUF4301 family protein [Marinoscillum furvescens]RED98985.1 uncharacterized protein DUF4301 [Marinoscillum furvescens DSM 4134]
MFNDSDLKQIADHQLSEDLIDAQIEKFKNGFPPTKLVNPAVEGSGLIKLSPAEADAKAKFYEDNLNNLEVVKFVPASGAATRMFKTLFAFLLEYKGTDADYEKMKSDQSAGSVFTFFKELHKFAFYEDLKVAFEKATGKTLEEAHLKREYTQILEVLLTEKGLNYGSLPKGLLKFHQYGVTSRTPVEEHVVEGAQYAKDADGNVKIHFTVSPDHQQKFEAHVSEIKAAYEKEYGVIVSVSYSIQKPSTDTIAVDLQNEPFRNGDGSLLFRPAGHGALLENLNDIDADVVFLKNIDNVVPDNLKSETIRYKKVIAGILLDYQQRINAMLSDLSASTVDQAKGLLAEMGYQVSAAFAELSTDEQVAFVKSKLDRPLRVCGMVKSDGDPGGGPFWVKDTDGAVSLQVVETAQIDLTVADQNEVFGKATHFNPVDVVCMLKDKDGNKYDLMKHRDPATGFITQKSKDGKDLKAQELPGLWNGSMADWNTVFVEVPAVTFNPVKSVNDLLKPEHQG